MKKILKSSLVQLIHFDTLSEYHRYIKKLNMKYRILHEQIIVSSGILVAIEKSYNQNEIIGIEVKKK